MKATKKQIATMDEIMSAIIQTEEWADIQESDPGIKLATQGYKQAIEKIKPFLSFEMLDELDTAVAGCLSALEFSAVLYGISVAETIRTASANPAAVSRHMLERIED